MRGIWQASFRLTTQELLASAAVSLCLRRLEKSGWPLRALGEVCFEPQYGLSQSATADPCGPRFVRITDIRAGAIDWETVPYCLCDNPRSYLLSNGDILVARSGSVGKSFVVSDVPEPSVFASYLIRLRTKPGTLSKFVFWCLQSQQFWYQVMQARRGSAMKNINGRMLAELKFPHPNVTLQRPISDFLDCYWERISRMSTRSLPALPEPLSGIEVSATRIEELAAKIEEARGLRRQVESDLGALCRSTLFSDRNGAPVRMRMDRVLRLRKPDVMVMPQNAYHFAGVYCFGKGLFRGEIKYGSEFSYSRLTSLRTGDFVYPKLMAWEGALGAVPPDCDCLVVSPEFPVFEVDERVVLPETLDVYFRSPSVWPLLSGASTGTNVRRRRLHPSQFLAFEMPIPPMKTQLLLREVKAGVDLAKHMQCETAAGVGALLPSILDKAFKGEL